MKNLKLGALLMLASVHTLAHDAEVTFSNLCEKAPGIYFIKIDNVYYKVRVKEKGYLILIDNPPVQASGGICNCISWDQKTRPPSLVCD